MPGLVTKPLGETVGAEVVDVDLERIRNDEALPAACLEALEANGVLVFPELGVDDPTQVAFCQKMGPVVAVPSHPIPEITVVNLDPKNPLAEYTRGTFNWHIDGATDDIPSKASVLTAHGVDEAGGDTEFASTYAAYEILSPDEQERYGKVRVVHTFTASQRPMYADPTPEQLADWARLPPKEHPLVWEHRSGRRSLVLGATADHVAGMDLDEGRALLADLLQRATTPRLVFRHRWSVGDMVIWDNRGVLHRAHQYAPTSPREMHRTTLVGDEPIR